MSLAALMPTVPCTADDRGPGALLALIGGREVALPLASMRVRATILDDVATTLVEQRFRNAHPSALLEVVHLFPIPEDGAVIDVELQCGDRTIRAECRERNDAERVFAEARAAGHRAALLTAERADVHTLRVTNLPAGTDVVVRLTVIERLDLADGARRWRFPTVIPPRYLDGAETGHSGPGVLPDTNLVPDASRLEAPLRLVGGTALDLEVRIEGQIRAVASSLHAVSLGFDGGLRVAPSAKATLDRDFILVITPVPPAAIGVRAVTDGGHTLVVVDPPVATRASMPRDAVFLVDISGSMEGTKLVAAKAAITAAVHGLMPGDRFRLMAFDDRVEAMSADFLPLDDTNLAKADRWLRALAPRGGTVMLPALEAALAGDTPEGRLRTVLFVTDGQSHDEQRLVALVAGRRRAARLFALGIDTAVNGALLKRLARVGGGTCELCTPRDDIDAVVANLEARFGSPIALDVTYDGLGAADPDPMVIFPGRPGVIVVTGAPAEVAVTFRTASGVTTLRAVPTRTTARLGPVWARARVAWLEDRITTKPWEEEALRAEIVRVALAGGVASRFTAFVAVDRVEVHGGERVVVVQPQERPADWDLLAGEATFGTLDANVFAAAPPPMSAPVAMSGPASPKRSRGALSRAMDAISSTFGPPAPLYPAPAPAPAQASRSETRAAQKAASADVAGDLARAQRADGSLDGAVDRTVAAVVRWVVLGHTRRVGVRQRAVQKAAAWLEGRAEALARVALDWLAAVEAGGSATPPPALQALLDGGLA